MSVFASCSHQITMEDDSPCWFDFGDGLSWGVLCPSCRDLYEIKEEDLPQGIKDFLVRQEEYASRD